MYLCTYVHVYSTSYLVPRARYPVRVVYVQYMYCVLVRTRQQVRGTSYKYVVVLVNTSLAQNVYICVCVSACERMYMKY